MNITVDAPPDIVEAAEKAVAEYWGEPVESISKLSPIESEDDEEEDELDD